MSIIAREVTKYYGEQKALNNVSFEIQTGAITGFLGPNGAGKSTMMKIITGFMPASSGVVIVGGTEVGHENRDLKRRIGYLPENNPLYPDMYVREYLMFVASFYLPRCERKRAVERITGVTGLVPEIKKKIGELSKGYRQRVGLAQALIHSPDVLILDEATTGLDPNQIVEIRNLISEAGREKTVMISTHIMQEVEAICDRVIIINEGSIVADDTRERVMSLLSESSTTVVVEFDGDPGIEMIETIPGAGAVTKSSDNEYIIVSKGDCDIRQTLIAWAVSNSLTVLSLQKKKGSLEEVFRHLTRGTR